MTFQPQNKERFERLRALTPMAAVRAWLDGDFGIGDEPAPRSHSPRHASCRL